MQSSLTWNVAKISCESQFSNTYKGKNSEFTESKTKYVTDGRISRILSANWKKFKLQYPIFDKLPHFAIFRLKVNGKIIYEKNIQLWCLTTRMYCKKNAIYVQEHGYWNDDDMKNIESLVLETRNKKEMDNTKLLLDVLPRSVLGYDFSLEKVKSTMN